MNSEFTDLLNPHFDLKFNYFFSIGFFIVGIFFLLGFYEGVFKRKVTILYGIPHRHRSVVYDITEKRFRQLSNSKEVIGNSAIIYGIIFGVISLILFTLAYFSFSGKNIILILFGYKP